MTDIAHDNALARRDAIAAEINETQQHLDALRKEAKRVDEWLDGWAEFAGKDVAGNNNGAERKKHRPNNPAKEIVVEYSRILVVENQAPMTRAAIMKGLEKEGILLNGTDPDMVLSTMLWRMKDRLIRLKGYGYWIPEMDYAPAGYKAPEGAEIDIFVTGSEALAARWVAGPAYQQSTP